MQLWPIAVVLPIRARGVQVLQCSAAGLITGHAGFGQAHRVIPVAALVLVLGICYGNLRDASDLRVAKRVQEGRHL